MSFLSRQVLGRRMAEEAELAVISLEEIHISRPHENIGVRLRRVLVRYQPGMDVNRKIVLMIKREGPEEFYVFFWDGYIRDVFELAEGHAEIASAVIALANNLNLCTVAEGVETAEQAAELHRLGATFLQGFRLAEPMTGTETALWFATRDQNRAGIGAQAPARAAR